jgi:hypothetical protein
VAHQQNEQKRRRLFPFVLLMLGLSIIGAPVMFVKLFKKLKEQVDLLEPLEQHMEGHMQNAWQNPNPELTNGEPLPHQSLNGEPLPHPEDPNHPLNQ